MIRIEPFEEALPPDWRRIVRDHPAVSLVAAAAAGFYLGRHHGRPLLRALVGLGISVSVASLKEALAPERSPESRARNPKGPSKLRRRARFGAL